MFVSTWCEQIFGRALPLFGNSVDPPDCRKFQFPDVLRNATVHIPDLVSWVLDIDKLYDCTAMPTEFYDRPRFRSQLYLRPGL